MSATERPACLSEHLQQAKSKRVSLGSSADVGENNTQSHARVQTNGTEKTVARCWTMRRHGDRLSFVLDTQSRPETLRTSEESALGLRLSEEEQGQPTSLPTNTCNECKQAGRQGDDNSSVSITNFVGLGQQQQQTLAPGWLEGW